MANITGVNIDIASYHNRVRAGLTTTQSGERRIYSVAPELQATVHQELEAILIKLAYDLINNSRHNIDINGEQFKVTREYSKGDLGLTSQTTITLTRGQAQIKIVFAGEDAVALAARLKQFHQAKPEPVDEAQVAARVIQIKISNGGQSVTCFPRAQEIVLANGTPDSKLVWNERTGRLTGKSLALKEFREAQV